MPYQKRNLKQKIHYSVLASSFNVCTSCCCYSRYLIWNIGLLIIPRTHYFCSSYACWTFLSQAIYWPNSRYVVRRRLDNAGDFYILKNYYSFNCTCTINSRYFVIPSSLVQLASNIYIYDKTMKNILVLSKYFNVSSNR